MIQMVFLMPIILSAAVVAFAGAMSIHITEKTNQICRTGLLSAEAHMIKQFNYLTSLNPTARILRNADRTAKLTIAIPIYGQVSAVSVTEARIIFHALQIGIIQSTNLGLKSDLLKTKIDLNRSVDFAMSSFVKSEIVLSPTLAVEASPRMNLTPDYKAKLKFDEMMTSQIKWTVQLEKMLPQWLIDFLNDQKIQVQNFDLNLSCASSAQKKENDQWQPSLLEKTQNQYSIIKVKQLSNSL